MKIHFCDLCNESVPEGDLKTGKAVIRKGRVVCATCDALMTREAGAVEGEPPTGDVDPAARAAQASPSPAATPVHARRAAHPIGGGAAFAAFLSLVIAGGGGWFLWRELVTLRTDHHRLSREMDRRLEASELSLDDVSRRSRQRDVELELSVGEVATSSLAAAQQEVAVLRNELQAALGEQLTLAEELRAEMVRVTDSNAAVGERLDELVARSIRSREEYGELSSRLVAVEGELARGAAAVAAPTVERAPAPPAWAKELAGLESESAGERWNAVTALGDTGDPAVVPHLVPLIGDPDVFVRMAVARVFGDLGAPEAVDSLIFALEDEEAVVREAAMVSLHAITGRDFRFDPMAGAAERAKKVKAWREWWEKARSEYLAGT